jgi:hypothetical protein
VKWRKSEHTPMKLRATAADRHCDVMTGCDPASLAAGIAGSVVSTHYCAGASAAMSGCRVRVG